MIACCDSVNHNRLQVLNIPLFLLTCRYVVHMTSGQYSNAVRLSRDIFFRVKPLTEFMTMNCVYTIPCWGKVYKDETCCPLNIRLEEHQKAVVQGEIKKSFPYGRKWGTICPYGRKLNRLIEKHIGELHALKD